MKNPARLIATLLTLLTASTSAPPAAHAEFPVEIEIDFGVLLGDQKSLSGMNHGALPLPDDPNLSQPAYGEFIEPLDFRVWSTGHNMTLEGYLEMVQDSHPEARAFLRVGGGLVKICPYEGDPTRPYLDFADYHAYVTCVAEWARDHGVDVLDIWNEPNMSDFSGNGQARKRDLFFQTFRIAHDAIRDVWPDAVIAAPSLGKTDQEGWLLDFMEFCEANDLQVPILTWHENGTIWNTDWFVDLPQKLQDARAAYIDGNEYRKVGAEEIVINESIAHAYNDIPANNLAVLYYLEQGGADGAARTCWRDDPSSECFVNTMNGLVTLPDGNGDQEKRAMWWLHRSYNETLENRVLVTSDLENVIGVANDRYALIGLYAAKEFPDTAPETEVQLTMRFKNVDRLPQVTGGTDELEMKLFEIPYDNSYAAVPELPLLLEGAVPIVDGPGSTREIVLEHPLEVHRVFVLEY